MAAYDAGFCSRGHAPGALRGALQPPLRKLPEWRVHPTNKSKSVSAHYGPHDCVLHFVRFPVEAGVEWEDLHLELSPGQWMYRPTAGVAPKRIDLAVVARQRLAAAELPVGLGDFVLEAVFEFALASAFWRFGAGSPRALVNKVDADIAKVGKYLTTGLAAWLRRHRRGVRSPLPSAYEDEARTQHGVEVLFLRQWR